MRPWGSFSIGEWTVQWDLNVPLPRLRWYWHDEGAGGLAVELTNGLSDPILAIDSPKWTPPRWLGDLLDRIS